MNLSVVLFGFTGVPILVTHSEGLYCEQKIVGCTSSPRSTSSNMKLIFLVARHILQPFIDDEYIIAGEAPEETHSCTVVSQLLV